MDYDEKALRKLAEAATPGPWHWDYPQDREKWSNELGRLMAGDQEILNFGHAEQYYPTEGEEPTPQDSAYIAAIDPTTLLALLDRIDDLEMQDIDD